MSYYSGQGDYYSGKGDPGLGSFFGGALKLGGSLIGGPLGALAKTAGTKLAGTKGSRPLVTSGRPPAIPVPGVQGFTQRLMPGGASGYMSGACTAGHHLNKSDYYLKGGQYVAAASTCVRNRRTNYTNPRALSRAAKRLDGFVGVARKALKSTNYKVVNKSYKQNWRKPTKR